jgi:hypothetical protein
MESRKPTSTRRNPVLLVLGGIVLVFIVWGVWGWLNWGQPGHGVDDSPSAIQGSQSAPAGGAVPASPDNSGRDATGDAVARPDREDGGVGAD